MKKSKVNNPELATYLASWMLAEHSRFHGLKKVPKDQKDAIQKRAREIVCSPQRKQILRVLEKDSLPVALIRQGPSMAPRVRNQQSISFFYEHGLKSKVLPWLRQNLITLGKQSPIFTQVGLSAKDDRIFGSDLSEAGFNTRYEILMGETKTALRNLLRQKRPSLNLDHLGLEIKEITTEDEIRAAMRLQKYVSRLSKRHGYFSHTADQLKKDQDEYLRIITGEMDGLILGVYRGKKILGLMVTGIHAEASKTERNGGFSFFLHPSIQGKGIAKTGYRILLEFLLRKKIYKFYGGTSQPAIQTLGKVMKRKVQHVIYVKMGRR